MSIVIDGIDLTELQQKMYALQKEQNDLRSKIKQGSSKFISDGIEQGKKLVQELLEAESQEQVDDLARQALKVLSDTKFVSDVSGISYELPYYDRQSDYYPYGHPFSRQIEEDDNETGFMESDDVCALYSLLEDMESDVSDWLTSYC